MIENWKVIEGFENYAVSDLGRVQRITSGAGAVKGRILRQSPQSKGYLTVSLGSGHTKSVHMLVAKAFLPNPLNLPEVNHAGHKTDNRATKLEWISTQAHALDKVLRNQQGEDGVHFKKSDKKWRASYSPEPNKWKHIGYFKTKEEALLARQKAVLSIEEKQ